MASQMERWINGDQTIPPYMTQAKTVFLSKDKNNSAYPEVGDVRVISILPAVTKLYEQVLLKKINAQLDADRSLHPNQRGFVKGKSTQHNLYDIYRIIKKAQEELKKQRSQKVPVKQRGQFFLLFIDLRKAFDTIDRAKLLQQMRDKRINTNIIMAMRDIYQKMDLMVDNVAVPTNIGVV